MKQSQIVLITLLVISFVLMLSVKHDLRTVITGSFVNTTKAVKNPLDGCYHVYLDVGSNIGVQVF